MVAISMLIAVSLASVLLYVNNNGGSDDGTLGDLRDPSYFEDNDYIPISDETEFRSIGIDSAFPIDGKYYLTDNIVMTGGNKFVGVGTLADPFTGIFDGNGYYLKANVTIMGWGTVEEMSRSFFSYVGGDAEFYNLGSYESEFTIFAASNLTRTGGIIGHIAKGANVTLENCYYYGTNNASLFAASGIVSSAGGLVAHSEGNLTIKNCYSNGGYFAIDARGVDAYSGGLVGYCSGDLTIADSYNKSYIYSATSKSSSIGGLVGYMPSGTLIITNSYNTRTVTIPSPDNNVTPKDHAGGIVGQKASGDTFISQCYNTGNITALGSNSPVAAGGIVGSLGTKTGPEDGYIITDCYNTGKVRAAANNANSHAGGILGFSEVAVDIYNCYSVGSIDCVGNDPSNTNVGGIFGKLDWGTIESCYYLEGSVKKNEVVTNTFGTSIEVMIDGLYGEVSGRVTHQASGSKTSAEMAPALDDARDGKTIYFIGTERGVLGWNFENIWTIVEGVNNGYPIFGISPPKADVTFYDAADEFVSKTTFLAGNPIPKADIPLVKPLPGYDYVWCTDPGRNTAWDFETIVTENMSLYLKYMKIDGEWATVTFYDDADEYVTSIYVLVGTPISSSKIPATVPGDGYKAVWYTESARDNAWDFGSDVTGDMDLYLQFEENDGKDPIICICGKADHTLCILLLALTALTALVIIALIYWRRDELEIGEIGVLTATGSQIAPTPWVRYNGAMLKAEEDFEYSYGENKDVGDGTVTITLLSTKRKVTVYFRIIAKS
jgi:hypothetical protein